MHFKNHPGHHFFVARIVGKPRICFEQDHLTRFHGFPYIAGIDLFVLDNVCTDRTKEKLKAKKAEFVITVADNIADGITKGREAQVQLAQCEAYTGKRIDRRLSGEALRIRMYELAEGLFASVPDKESDALVQMMPCGLYDHSLYIPKEYYRETIRLPYMDTTIQVPLCYDAVMRRKYGNYMVLRKDSAGHDYPFFYGQHRDLVAVLDFEYPAFKAGAHDITGPVRRVAGEDDGPKDIVFMPFAAKHWKYMEKLYAHYAGQDDYNVHVVPIPYYYKAWDGSLSEEVFDIYSFPSDVPVEDYRCLDLARMHPAKIVIQNPFDEWNGTYSVTPAFYSKKIRAFTDELIYIPFFVTDDFTKRDEREYINMDHYVCMPGVIYADTVILPSETLKTVYIEKITEFICSDEETVLEALDRKIKVCSEYIYYEDEAEEEGPGCEIIPDGRKTIVYFLTISFLAENGKKAIEKIAKDLKIFAQDPDKIKVIWITQCCRQYREYLDKDVADAFDEAVERFNGMKIGEYIEDLSEKEYKRYVRTCDAYYGDPSSLALRFVYAKKPVMIQNAT